MKISANKYLPSNLKNYKFQDRMVNFANVYDSRDNTDNLATLDRDSEDAVKVGDKYLDKDFVQYKSASDAREIGKIMDAFREGSHEDGIKLKDAMFSNDYPELFLTATEIVLKQRLYPETVITDNLFQSIPYMGHAETVTIRTLGGAKIEEVAEGSEYPETSAAVNDQAYRIHLEIRKYGAKLGGTRELIESDNWGIFAASIADMVREIGIVREKQAINKMNTEGGFTVLDNSAPGSGALGRITSGRGLDGAFNGALGVDDVYEIFAYQQMRGYTTDTIVIHPFAWMLWARDPEMQEGLLGSNTVYMPSGNAAPGWGSLFNGFGVDFSKYGAQVPSGTPGNVPGLPGDSLYGKLGVGSSYNYPHLSAMGSTFMTQPKHMPAVKIIVSPFVPFYKGNVGGVEKYITNIMFADSRRCGVILEKEAPNLESWNDVEKEIDYVKVRAKWGMAFMDQGRAIAVARNIVIDRTYGFNLNSDVGALPKIDGAPAVV